MNVPYKNTIWSSRVHDQYGNLKHETDHNLNLRTNVGNDWQYKVMAGDNVTGAQMQGTASATSATSLTTSGLTASALIDHIIYVGANGSGTGSIVWGVITANSTTVITVDKWYDPTSPGGAAGTTPNATAKYQISPTAAPAVYLALSSTVQSGAAGDTTLPGELSTNGFSRAYPTTFTHSASSSAYSLSKTFTASGTATINSEAMFTAASVGTPAFISAETSPPTLVSGDTLAQTAAVNY
jgi:hypothetical protein